MTNGEKIQTILDIDQDCTEVYGKNGMMTFSVTQDWWNTEYKEPTTKNDLGVDCISREQALVAIRNLYPDMPRVDFSGSLRKWVDKYKPYIECDDAIKQLPPVTPQEPKWIPVSERLPEERHGVLVLCPTRKNIYCACYEEKQWWIFGAYREKVTEEIVAWMPLPKAYREVEE